MSLLLVVLQLQVDVLALWRGVIESVGDVLRGVLKFFLCQCLGFWIDVWAEGGLLVFEVHRASGAKIF